MNSPSVEEKQAPSFQRDAVLDSAISNPIPWHQAHQFLREMEDHMRLVSENAQDGEVSMRLLVERLPATFEAVGQAHEELDRRVAQRSAGLSQANAGLSKQITENAQAERCLDAEQSVPGILSVSTRPTDAALTILQSISQSLEWNGGALRTFDRDAEVLRCLEVWHAPMGAIAGFEQVSRQHTFSPTIGLPGRVWASDSSPWIPDVTQDANFPGAAISFKEALLGAVGLARSSE